LTRQERKWLDKSHCRRRRRQEQSKFVAVFKFEETFYIYLQAIKGSRTVPVAGRVEAAAVGGSKRS
jgi:hypothetical protein